MMNPIRIFLNKANLILFVSVLLMSTSSIANPTFEEVIEFTSDKQAEYLSGQFHEDRDRCNEQLVQCSILMIEIAAFNSRSSELAMYYLQNLILLSSSSPAYKMAHDELADSEYFESQLLQLILSKDINEKVVGGAIISHAWLYSPEDEALDFYENEILNATAKERGVVESILIAFEQYKTRQGYEIPDYVVDKLPELMVHSSDAVSSQAIGMLSDLQGKAFLPELFIQLDSKNHGTGVSQTIVFNILSIDTSKETIERLRYSGDLSDNKQVKEIIANSILPQNLKRYQHRVSE